MVAMFLTVTYIYHYVLQFWFHLISLCNNRVLQNYQNGRGLSSVVIQLMCMTRINLCVGILMRFLILMLVNVCIMEIILLDVRVACMFRMYTVMMFDDSICV